MIYVYDQGRNSRQSSEVAESLFGRLTFRATLPILGMEILNVPLTYRNQGRSPKPLVCNSYQMQTLACPKVTALLLGQRLCE
jgi:hypothetical protein